MLQKQGPGPGDYEIKDAQPVPIRSSFVSKVPRILPAHTVSIILKMAQSLLAAVGLTWDSDLLGDIPFSAFEFSAFFVEGGTQYFQDIKGNMKTVNVTQIQALLTCIHGNKTQLWRRSDWLPDVLEEHLTIVLGIFSEVGEPGIRKGAQS